MAKPEDGQLVIFLTRIFDEWAQRGGVMFDEHGFLCYCWDTEEPEVAWTGPLWVHPDYRRRGIAGSLFRRLRQELGGRKIRSKTRRDRPDVTGLYQKLGRDIVGQDDTYLYWESR